MKVGMLSPYSLSRPGGVQGQVFGLSRALRKLGHEVTVIGPQDEGATVADENVVVVGRPTGLHSNGSVAPVTISPMVSVRTERFVRHSDFDVLHIHEPLAPMAPYGLMITDPVPMVGTFHRAGVSRWVPVLKPLARLVGRRMEVRVAVSEAARETGIKSAGGDYEVLFNGVDIERFSTAVPTPTDDRPTVLFLGRHEARKGLGVLLDAFAELDRPAVLWVAGAGSSSEVERRRHPESDRVKWLGLLSDEEVAARAAGADVVPSIGGWSGNKLGPNCATAIDLAGAYQKVINAFSFKAIDIDIENTDEFENNAIQDKILSALKIVKQNNPSVKTIVTFGTTTTGPNSYGTRLVQQAKALGSNIDVFTQMPFDFGGGSNMYTSTVNASEGLKNLLKTTFGYTDAQAYSHEGISGMNGLSDQQENTTTDTWTRIRDYAKSKGFARFTFWAVNRDRGCAGGGVVSNCSGIAQADWAFTKISAGF